MSRHTPANVCFHGIGSPQRTLEPGESNYWVSKDRFLSILDAITLWPGTDISFDDANASDIEIGLSALADRNLTATFFVPAGRLNAAGSLSERDVKELTEHGMRIGSHGMEHSPWRGMDETSRVRELVEARDQLAGVIDRPVSVAALPLGQYDRALLRHLRALDYENVYTSDRRIARPSAWLQPRFSVLAGDNVESFTAQIDRARGLCQRLKLNSIGLVKQLR